MAVTHPRDRALQIAAARDAAALQQELTDALHDPAFAAHDEALVELGAAAARGGHRGLDRVLFDLAGCAPDARTAALLVLAGYWHAAERVDPAVYAGLVDLLHRDAALWDDDQRAGIAAFSALTALTVHPDRGVAPAAATAERLAVLRRVKHTSPYLAGVAARAGV
jgi:hypothetical protein